jgi:hypothetical protein
MEELMEDLTSNAKLRPIKDDGEADVALWNGEIARYFRGKDFMSAPWLFAEGTCSFPLSSLGVSRKSQLLTSRLLLLFPYRQPTSTDDCASASPSPSTGRSTTSSSVRRYISLIPLREPTRQTCLSSIELISAPSLFSLVRHLLSISRRCFRAFYPILYSFQIRPEQVGRGEIRFRQAYFP